MLPATSVAGSTTSTIALVKSVRTGTLRWACSKKFKPSTLYDVLAAIPFFLIHSALGEKMSFKRSALLTAGAVLAASMI